MNIRKEASILLFDCGYDIRNDTYCVTNYAGLLSAAKTQLKDTYTERRRERMHVRILERIERQNPFKNAVGAY